jgi:hypothetical protein
MMLATIQQQIAKTFPKHLSLKRQHDTLASLLLLAADIAGSGSQTTKGTLISNHLDNLYKEAKDTQAGGNQK